MNDMLYGEDGDTDFKLRDDLEDIDDNYLADIDG